jgi:drug/metabolite transporter (DMT)-like permease
MNNQHNKTREPGLPAVAAISALCVLFGSNAIAIKLSFAGFGPFTAAGLRFAMASAAISLWAMATGRPFAIKKGQGIHLILLSIIFTVQLSLFYFGLSITNASRGILIVNFQPFVVLILAHFFIPDDRISKKKTAGLVLGFAGVSFVLLDPGVASAGIRSGDLLILGTTILWGINAVYVKRIVDGFQVFHIVLYPMLLSVPFFLLAGFVWDPVMVGQIDWIVLAALLYQGIVTAAFGFVVWNYFLKIYGVVTVHSFTFIMPMSGVLLGGLILGEPITNNILVALVLIGSGIFVVNYKRKKAIPSLQISRNV